MSADDLMDARLREAGERWRSATDVAGAVPTSSSVVELTSSAQRRRVRWPMLASAAAVVALAVGLTTFFVTTSDDNRTVGSSSSAIVGPTWHVISVVTPDGMSHPGYGPATLHIDARGRLTATDGCNTLGADVVVRAHTIAFPHGVAKTEIACLRPGATFAWTANTVDSVLKGAARWNVSAARLTISRHGAGSVTYGKSASNNSVEPTLLPGTWQLTSIEREIGNSGSAEGSSAMGTKITISGKMLKVTHACYVNRAAISVGRGRLTIRNVTLDRAIPCPSNAGSKYDGTVDDVLTGTCTWKFVENSLWITKGKVWLTFTR